MARSGESLLALKSAMHKLPQTLINVTVPEGFVLEQSDAVHAESQRVQALLKAGVVLCCGIWDLNLDPNYD